MKATTDNQQQLAIFDFDKTLINTDVAYHFINRSIARSWLRRLVFILLTPLLLPLYAMRPCRRIPMAAMMWLATFPVGGKSVDEVFAAFVPQIWQAPIHGRFYAEGLEAVKQYQQSGHRVVILTGSPQPLVKQLARQIPPGKIEVIGSQIVPFLGGLIYRRYAMGAEKIRLSAAHGLPTTNWSVGYSDSTLDLPLLAHCRRPFLINPDRSTLQRVEKVLEKQVTVLRWSNTAPTPSSQTNEA